MSRASRKALRLSDPEPSLRGPLVLVAALSFVFLLLFFPLPLAGDAASYYKMSVDLLARGTSDFFWPLGWPAAMACIGWVFGTSETSAKAFSFLLAFLALVLQFKIVQKGLQGVVRSRRRWRMAYGLILLNSPYLIYHGTSTLTVVPMAFLGSLLVYLLLFKRSPLPIAVTMSSMVLVRFGSIGILPAVVLFRYLLDGSIRRGVASVATALVLLIIPIAWVSHSLGQLVLLNKANGMNLFYGNHQRAPIYETWRWGSHEDAEKLIALNELTAKYSLDPTGSRRSTEYIGAMRKEAISQILDRPDLYILRMFTRASVLLAFDSSISGALIKTGERVLGVGFLIFMVLASLVTKTSALAGVIASDWKGRHLIWLLLGGLSVPHLVAFAHPSYTQMFTIVVLPVIAIAIARIEVTKLREKSKLVFGLTVLVGLCHLVFAGYMAHTRL